MGKVKKMDCTSARNKMSDFVEYKLTREDARELIEHCYECEKCLDEINLLLLIDNCLDEDVSNDKLMNINEEIDIRYMDIMEHINYINMIDRNMMFFVSGSTLFLILMLLVNLFL